MEVAVFTFFFYIAYRVTYLTLDYHNLSFTPPLRPLDIRRYTGNRQSTLLNTYILQISNKVYIPPTAETNINVLIMTGTRGES